MKTIHRIVAAAALALAAGPAGADETRIDQRRAAAADGVVEVSNVAGSIRIVGWARNEVHVEGTVGDGVERVEFGGTEGRTTVRVELKRGPSIRGRDADADLMIRVPARSRIAASTVSAALSSDGVRGELELRSVSGDVDAAGEYTTADLQSVSGTVRVRSTGAGARVNAGSISGTVAVEGARGEVTANSVSGVVLVEAPGLTRASLKSVSGEATYAGSFAADGVYEVETVSGTARVVAARDVDARFDLTTFSGEIRNAFGPRPQRTSEYAPGQSLRFSEGQGRADVQMRSITGTVRLDRR